jgi:tetratricopeptide (TPR) repeat protein
MRALPQLRTSAVVAACLLILVAGNAKAQLHIEPSNGKPVVQYDLDVALMPDAHRMEVTGTMNLPADVAVRNTIEFSLRTDMSSPRVEVVKPDVCTGNVELRDLGDDKELQGTKRWELKPRVPIPAGSNVVLKIAYAGGSETNGKGFFNVGPEGSFGNGGISAWYPNVGYHRAVGTLRFKVPKPLIVKATGQAKAQREVGETVIFEFTISKPSVFDFVAGNYVVIKRREGRIPVTLYLFKHHQREDEMLVGTSRIMEVLEKEFGPYPFGEFAIVESATAPSQGAGFLGVAFNGFFLARSDFLERNTFDLWYFGHELTHQWFPYLVGHKGTGTDTMMTEALAQYGGLRALEELAGSAAAERFRREGGRDALRLMTGGYDYPLGSLPDDSAAYTLSNTKGDFVYDMLARVVGRDKFRKAIRNVTSKYAYGALTWDEFLKEIEQAAGQNLAWFYEQWFSHPGAPVLTVQWNQIGGDLHYTVTQEKPAFRLALPVQVEFSDGTAITQEAKVASEKDEFTLKVTKPVHAVRLDPHYNVFHATPEQKAEAEALHYFTRGKLMWNHNQTDEALKTFQEGLQHLPEVDAFAVEFMLRLHIGWIHQEAKRFDEAKNEYELALALPNRSKEDLPRLYLNMAKIAKEQGDGPATARAVQGVIATEHSLGPETAKSRQARQLLENKTP